MPQTILSPNVELVFLSLLWTGFVPSFFFVEVWLDEPLGCDRGRDYNNNSVFLLTVDDTMSMVGSATTTTMRLIDPDFVLDGNDNNNGTFALRSKILSMIICSPNCDVTPDFLSLALPFTSNIKSNITNVRFLRYLFTYV